MLPADTVRLEIKFSRCGRPFQTLGSYMAPCVKQHGHAGLCGPSEALVVESSESQRREHIAKYLNAA